MANEKMQEYIDEMHDLVQQHDYEHVMDTVEPTNPTQDNLDWLAEFCGAVDAGYGVGEGWVFGKQRLFIARADFNPYKRWQDCGVVLNVLVEKEEKRLETLASNYLLGAGAEQIMEWMRCKAKHQMLAKKPFNFLHAVCEAALASGKDK